jgi:hypothetical protein
MRIAGLRTWRSPCWRLRALYVRDRIVELGDPAATTGNIRASATLFRAGFVADLAQATIFLFTAMALYLLPAA